MVVRLTKRYPGSAQYPTGVDAGKLYDGPDQDYLLSIGAADRNLAASPDFQTYYNGSTDVVYPADQRSEYNAVNDQWGNNRGVRRNQDYQVIGHRMLIPRSTSTSTATYLQHESRIQFRVGPQDASDIRLGYCSWFDNEVATTGEAEIATDATIRSAIEMATPNPLTVKGKFGGAITGTLKAGQELMLCDPIPVTLKANTNYFAQSGYKVLAQGDLIPTSQRNYNTNDRGFRSAGGSTQVGNNGNWSTPADSGTPTEGWGPSLIIGIPKTPIVSVMLRGHSQISGTGDASTGDGLGNIGYAARALGNMDASNNVIPYAYWSKAGNTLNREDYNPDYRKRRAYRYFTDCFWDNGINDVVGGNLATMQAQALRDWAELRAAGLRITAFTQTTKTTGAWTLADGSDQTVTAGFEPGGLCDQFNAWLFTQVGVTIDAVLDKRPYVQNMTTNKFLADGTVGKYTTDGTHYTTFAATALADGLVRPYAKTLTVFVAPF